MVELNQTAKDLLKTIADIEGPVEGAYSIRSNGKQECRWLYGQRLPYKEE